MLGGLQEAVSQLAREFRAQGHEVMVITNRYPRELKKEEDIDGIPVKRILFPGLYLSSLNPYRILKYIAGLMIGFVNFFRLVILLKRARPAVVNIHFLGSQASFAMLASKILGIKCVVSLHGDDVEGLPLRSKVDRWLFRQVAIAADHVTACSAFLLDEAKKLVPEIGSKSTAIHNGIRPEEFQNVQPYNHTAPYIFAAGRFVHKKGFDLLLRAYKDIVNNRRRIDLILAGEGPENENLVSLTTDLGFSPVFKESLQRSFNDQRTEVNSVIFWGRATRDEMKSLMKGCEVFVIPSRQEPFGIVALEAFAAGKKVVASKTGGLAEIVLEGKGDRLVAAENVEELAEGIRLTLQNKTENVVHDLEEKSWETAAKRYLDIFTRINA